MRAVKAVGFLGALAALMLAGCGDGSIKSPDFESATTLESIVVQPAVVGQPNTLPAGTTLSYRAIATFSETVQPGTEDSAGHEISERTRTRSEEHTMELQSIMRSAYGDFGLKKK